MHRKKLATLSHALILLLAGLTLTLLEHHLTIRDAQHLRDGSHHVLQPRLRFILTDGRGRCVFLHMHPVGVDIDRYGELRHIGVVQTIALDILLASPFAK